jgi:histone deacetylase complex regulatory component SIN3
MSKIDLQDRKSSEENPGMNPARFKELNIQTVAQDVRSSIFLP